MYNHVSVLILGVALVTSCGGDDDDDTSLNVAWSFESGDCATSGVQTVRVTWGPQGGATQSVDFACQDGVGLLGDTGGGGTFVVNAQGLDADGVARTESYGASITVGAGGTLGMPLDITLYPMKSDVTVSWSFSDGQTCPPGVTLPYFVTLYVPPAPGGELTEAVATVQQSCVTGQASLTDVTPGDHVLEVDSRAVTPAVRATMDLTLEPGVDLQVEVQL